MKLNLIKTDGKINFDKTQFSDYINELVSGVYTVEIKKFKTTRSMNQNKFYWEIIKIIGNELGYEQLEMHETFKATYLGKIDDNGLIYAGSTKKLSIQQMKDYIESIVRFAAKNGIVIPENK